MDLSGIASSVTAAQAASTQGTAGMLVMRKVVDEQASEGARLLKLMEQSAGLGQNLDTTA
ncbi:MAG TPA: putative motility protein [Holophaga sp.]|nr:putative motility protein [Holophaga sp.]HPS66822.1 putative motility protein [Holophaga sp.]